MLLFPTNSRRRASKVAWDLCPERVQELAGYPLNGRPSAVTMLELLYNGVARYDDLSILKQVPFNSNTPLLYVEQWGIFVS